MAVFYFSALYEYAIQQKGQSLAAAQRLSFSLKDIWKKKMEY